MLGKKIKIAVDNRPFFYYNILRQWISDICASGSGVEHHLAKVGAAGSNPVSRSFYFVAGSLILQGFPTFFHLFL